MKNNGSSERYQINNLKTILSYSMFIGSSVSLDQVKSKNEDEEKKRQEIRKCDGEESERLHKKSIFVTNDSIKFTRNEYDKLKTAFCKGKGWSLDYPHTVNVHSITLKGNYKWMPTSDVEFSIEIE